MSSDYSALYKSIAAGVYKTELTHLITERNRTIKAIELFTDRISRAKNLLLDNHINFQDYLCIRDDCEDKINLLGNSISSMSARQIEISGKIETFVEHSSKLDTFFASLDEKNKSKFLKLILVKTSNWELSRAGHVFLRPVQVVYDIRPFTDPNIANLDRAAIVDFLQSLAELEFLQVETPR